MSKPLSQKCADAEMEAVRGMLAAEHTRRMTAELRLADMATAHDRAMEEIRRLRIRDASVESAAARYNNCRGALERDVSNLRRALVSHAESATRAQGLLAHAQRRCGQVSERLLVAQDALKRAGTWDLGPNVKWTTARAR